MLETFFNSFLLVALTEMGDKTQLLAFVLATRFKKPWAIISGILVATVLNHLLAASLGAWLASLISPTALRWSLAIIFIAFAIWILIPDKDDDQENSHKFGAFVTTLIAFFIAEMGDKTQLSTVALAAKYYNVTWVTIGTTLGMLAADGPAVFLGEKFAQKVSMKWIRWVASSLFVIFGVGILLNF